MMLDKIPLSIIRYCTVRLGICQPLFLAISQTRGA